MELVHENMHHYLQLGSHLYHIIAFCHMCDRLLYKFMPCLLTEEQKQNHVNMCHNLVGGIRERDPYFLLEVITASNL
jgi:hypothetical protein